MVAVRRISVFGFAPVLAILTAAIFSIGLKAQAGDPATLIQEKLVTQIKLTKTTGAHDDIVTAGDIVLLHKDGLMMCAVTSSYAFSNTYVNGILGANMKNRAKDALRGWGRGLLTSGSSDVAGAAGNGCPSRKFVAGEKFWITGVQAQKDGILISAFSDPYKDPQGNDTRYYAEIKFLFPNKGSVPPVDTFVKTVGEVITVAPADDKDKGGQNDQASAQSPQQSEPAAPAAAPAPPIEAIAPPPPPADAPPPTIAIGQTKDQVVAGFGQPARQAKLAGTKEIYFYKDMKVTFTNGKVSNVE
jgi:hypothetical protein